MAKLLLCLQEVASFFGVEQNLGFGEAPFSEGPNRGDLESIEIRTEADVHSRLGLDANSFPLEVRVTRGRNRIFCNASSSRIVETRQV